MNDLLSRVVQQYLMSPDFNGYRFGISFEDPSIKGGELRTLLKQMIESDEIVVRLGGFSINPMIRHYPDKSTVEQFEMLDKCVLDSSEFTVLYPSKRILREVVDPSKYDGQPFSLMLAYGEAQLDFCSFDLSVLEKYRNDPRYYYEADDLFGSISVKDHYYVDNKMRESDQAFLQTFGFSYDDDMNRAVAVYIRYLHDLTPEHQRIWHAHLLEKTYKLHPEYYRATILGEFAETFPILTAFRMELHHINEMCKLMDRPPLFREELEPKPRGFAFLIRPTSKEYYDFIHLLDKAMSDNINTKFFKGEVPNEEEFPRKDGKIEVRTIGTIRQLESWIAKTIRNPDTQPLQQMFSTFRKVRKLRQQPAHAIHDDSFDQEFVKLQRQIVIEAYTAVRTIRLLFTNHPNCQNYAVDEALRDGKISAW